MKQLLVWALSLTLLAGVGSTYGQDRTPAKLPALKPGEAVATFAGGCFWAMEEGMNQLKGVREVVSGYAGGTTKNPSYEEVGTDLTGHAESVQVYYDPKVISYAKLLDAFFAGHDPTTLNRQGYDVGTQYRSAMFPADDEQRRLFEASIARAQEFFDDPVVTAVEPMGPVHEAEYFHQDFYGNQPFNGYCQVIINPKLAKVRKHYAAWLTD